VEGVTAPGAEEQPAIRKLPVSTVPARAMPTLMGLVSEAAPSRFRAWSFTQPSLTPGARRRLRQST